MGQWLAKVNAGFPTLFRSLGITVPVGKVAQFDLGGIISPVAIVSNEGPSVTTTLDNFATGGFLTAPAIGTVLADTGPLQAGVYPLVIVFATNDTVVAGGFTVQRRNFDNTTNIWFQYFAGMPFFFINVRFVLNDQERIRVVKDSPAPTAGAFYMAGIWQSTV